MNWVNSNIVYMYLNRIFIEKKFIFYFLLLFDYLKELIFIL